MHGFFKSPNGWVLFTPGWLYLKKGECFLQKGGWHIYKRLGVFTNGSLPIYKHVEEVCINRCICTQMDKVDDVSWEACLQTCEIRVYKHVRYIYTNTWDTCLQTWDLCLQTCGRHLQTGAYRCIDIFKNRCI